MSRDNSITLLHLSDIQFGKNHRFGMKLDRPDEAVDTLLHRLLDDLKQLKKDQGVHSDLIALTGDLAEWGVKSEFDAVMELVVGLGEALELERSRIVLVPGNHDINRNKCLAHFADRESEELDPQPPYWPKWHFFKRFFDQLYRDEAYQFTEDEPWTLFEIPDLQLVIAGFNSTIIESHLDEEEQGFGHYGWVGEHQLKWFAERLEPYRERGWLRIGAVHHNVRRKALADDENLRDADDLERILVDSGLLNLVLHGHTHEGRMDWWRPAIPIFATGSTALNPETRPEEVPNQYQILRLERGGFRQWCRQYAGKQFIGDNRATTKGDDWKRQETVEWSDSNTTLPEPTEAAAKEGKQVRRQHDAPYDIRDERPRDDFLSRVETVCRYREEGEIQIERLQRGDPPLDYLRVTVSEGPIARVFPVCGREGPNLGAELERFRRQVVDKYRSSDNGVIAHFVYGGSVGLDGAVQQEAERQRIRLFSFVEYQGLIDFRTYLRSQTDRLAADPVYPPGLYVPQRIRYEVGREAKGHDDAFSLVRGWLEESAGRFILILGEFGTGKTFLLRELARRLGEEQGPLTPVLVEMRDLEKGRSLDQLIAQHLADRDMTRFDLAAFRYMLAQGRILLLFDGFDELATRVSYDRATAHLETLIEAAKGEYAKVVVSSRTQHFESDNQVKTVLGSRVETIPRHRIAWLQPFDEEQIRSFLRNRLQDEAAAEQRFELIMEIHDLLGLSHNPRLLGFIADLPEEDLQAARGASGEITAAALYQALLSRWLAGEHIRIAPRGTQPLLKLEERWQAMGHLAELLWQRTERTVPISELGAEVQAALEELHKGALDRDLATHQVGSGTLLVRDQTGNFGFIHQSVMEWLVADRAARRIGQGEAAEFLDVAEMSLLMADFFRDRCGRDGALAWARDCLSRTGEGAAKRNALLVLKCLGATAPAALTLSGEDLRGRDFSGQDLSSADLRDAELSHANMVGTMLRGADLSDACLRGADLTRADLSTANLSRADFTAARLSGADLTAARFDGADFTRARLLGSRGLEPWPAEATGVGAAPVALEQAGPTPAPCFNTCMAPRSLAVSPDGSLLAVASGRGVRIWSLADEVELLRLQGHDAEVTSIAFSPDGRTLASASDDESVRLWECASGKQLALLRGHEGPVTSVAFSPDGRTLASASRDRTIRLREGETGRQIALLRGHEDSVMSIAFSPDGHTLASASDDNTVRLWECASGRQLVLLRGHGGWVTSVAFSPDGHILASASYDNTVHLWEGASGRQLTVLRGHEDRVSSVTFNPDGRTLASTSGDRTVRLWEGNTGRHLALLRGHEHSVSSVTFSPDGRILASASHDNTVLLWEGASSRQLAMLRGHENVVSSVVFSPDGRNLASASDDETVRLWEGASGRQLVLLRGHEHWVTSVAFSPDGHTVASASRDRTVRLWEGASSRQIALLRGHEHKVTSVAFSPDGQTLASASGDKTVRLWEGTSGRQIALFRGHEDWVLSVAFSPDGLTLASASGDKTVRLWEGATGRHLTLLQGHENWVRSVAFSPDGHTLASASDDGTIRLWEGASGRQMALLRGHEHWVTSVAFSPDGCTLASASDDNTVRLWESASGRQLAVLRGHENSVRSVAFSPNGHTLASASADNTIRLWSTTSHRCLAILMPTPEGWAAWSPDGRYKYGGDITGHFWHAINLCRFEPGELDEWVPGLRMEPDEKFIGLDNKT